MVGLDWHRSKIEITHDAVFCLSVLLHSDHMVCLPETVFFVAARVKHGNGLEGLRRLRNQHEPRTALTNRAHLKAILNNPPAMRIEELDSKMMKV